MARASDSAGNDRSNDASASSDLSSALQNDMPTPGRFSDSEQLAGQCQISPERGRELDAGFSPQGLINNLPDLLSKGTAGDIRYCLARSKEYTDNYQAKAQGIEKKAKELLPLC
jgi:hypothetical protein